MAAGSETPNSPRPPASAAGPPSARARPSPRQSVTATSSSPPTTASAVPKFTRTPSGGKPATASRAARQSTVGGSGVGMSRGASAGSGPNLAKASAPTSVASSIGTRTAPVSGGSSSGGSAMASRSGSTLSTPGRSALTTPKSSGKPALRPRDSISVSTSSSAGQQRTLPLTRASVSGMARNSTGRSSISGSPPTTAVAAPRGMSPGRSSSSGLQQSAARQSVASGGAPMSSTSSTMSPSNSSSDLRQVSARLQKRPTSGMVNSSRRSSLGTSSGEPSARQSYAASPESSRRTSTQQRPSVAASSGESSPMTSARMPSSRSAAAGRRSPVVTTSMRRAGSGEYSVAKTAKSSFAAQKAVANQPTSPPSQSAAAAEGDSAGDTAAVETPVRILGIVGRKLGGTGGGEDDEPIYKGTTLSAVGVTSAAVGMADLISDETSVDVSVADESRRNLEPPGQPVEDREGTAETTSDLRPVTSESVTLSPVTTTTAMAGVSESEGNVATTVPEMTSNVSDIPYRSDIGDESSGGANSDDFDEPELKAETLRGAEAASLQSKSVSSAGRHTPTAVAEDRKISLDFEDEDFSEIITGPISPPLGAQSVGGGIKAAPSIELKMKSSAEKFLAAATNSATDGYTSAPPSGDEHTPRSGSESGSAAPLSPLMGSISALSPRQTSELLARRPDLRLPVSRLQLNASGTSPLLDRGDTKGLGRSPRRSIMAMRGARTQPLLSHRAAGTQNFEKRTRRAARVTVTPASEVAVKVMAPHRMQISSLTGEDANRGTPAAVKQAEGSREELILTCHETAVISSQAILSGTISVGARTVIHPAASIDASSGPVTIGPNCVIEEQVEITSPKGGMTIGEYNMFEIGTRVTNVSKIGNRISFGIKSSVIGSLRVPSGVSIGAGASVIPGEPHLFKNCAVYGPNSTSCSRPADQVDSFLASLDGLLPVLAAQIKKFHTTRKGGDQPDNATRDVPQATSRS